MAMAKPTTSNELRFDAFQKCFMRGEARIAGLLPLLANRFYPHYSYPKAKYNKEESDITEYRQRQMKKDKPRVRAKGVDMGMLVDKEIVRSLTVFLAFPQVRIRAMWDTNALASAEMAPWGKQILGNVLMQTRAFWREMEVRKLRPIRAQQPVGTQYVATAVDVVALDEQGRTVLLEVKCGFTGYYNCCTEKKMAAPLQLRTDSLSNQHQLQLAGTLERYRLCNPTEVLGEALIVHIENAKVSCYPLKPWVKEVHSFIGLLFQSNSELTPAPIPATATRKQKKRKREEEGQ